jgi:hypothetical protein
LEAKVAENKNIFAAFSIYCNRIVPEFNKYNLTNQLTANDAPDPLKAKLASDIFIDYYKGITQSH